LYAFLHLILDILLIRESDERQVLHHSVAYLVSASDNHLTRRVYPRIDFFILIEMSRICAAVYQPDVRRLTAANGIPVHAFKEWMQLYLVCPVIAYSVALMRPDFTGIANELCQEVNGFRR
jgi:hypothetical protein